MNEKKGIADKSHENRESRSGRKKGFHEVLRKWGEENVTSHQLRTAGWKIRKNSQTRGEKRESRARKYPDWLRRRRSLLKSARYQGKKGGGENARRNNEKIEKAWGGQGNGA